MFGHKPVQKTRFATGTVWLSYLFNFSCSCIQMAAKMDLFHILIFQTQNSERSRFCMFFSLSVQDPLFFSAPISYQKISSELWWEDKTREIVYYSEWSFRSNKSFELICCCLSSLIQNLICPKFQPWWTFPKQKQQAASHHHILGLYPAYPYAADVNIIYWHKQLSAHGISLSLL